jgi:photosystem II cytochrome c550
MKNLIKVISRTLFSVLALLSLSSSSWASELDEAIRTVQLNPTKTVTLSLEQVKRGKRLFNNSCSVCHTGGITKTNPNVGLDS